jgi:hypothetical protein
MRLVEMIRPLGPLLTSPVTAIVQCDDPSDVPLLPGVAWHGVANYTGGEYRAHLVGWNIETANRILALAGDW